MAPACLKKISTDKKYDSIINVSAAMVLVLVPMNPSLLSCDKGLRTTHSTYYIA